MKKSLLLLSIIFLSFQAEADKPPATYQQFKAEFVHMKHSNSSYFIEISENTGRWIAGGAGAALVGISGYFLINNQMTQFQNAVLIGGAAYIPLLAILILSEDEGSKFPYY
ncbi:MAG: hypothetical protein ACOCTU_06630 [Bacteroidota bacterium]